MASGKKESEAFNMLKFMYQDDDDDMEDADRDEDDEQQQPSGQFDSDSRTRSEADDSNMRDSEQRESMATDADDAQDQQQQLNLRPPTPLVDALLVESNRYKRERPTIVDYGHDEAAMSPEPEEGEILANGRAIIDLDAKNATDFQEGAMAENVEISSTPSIHSTPPSSVRVENSVSDVVDNALKKSEVEDLTGGSVAEVAPLDKFLPPTPKGQCPKELQGKINKFLGLKKMGKSFNSEVRNRKDYRNPDFLLHAVSYQDIDQTGSCFSKDVFDPHGYDESDYYDAIEVDMKLELERKEQERKKSPKVDFVSAGNQQAAVLAAAKISMSVSGVPNLPIGGIQSASVSADALSREGRQNKKSKWDKVDGDQRPALGSGHVSQTSVGAHATFLSTANAGSGYAMFAQQKRRELEEKRSSRSSERKADRRS